MFCEPYRKALSEAAVRREGLSRAGEAHLAGCAACREALADEQALMALVDGALRTVANAEPPSSLVPRVRAQIAEAPAAPAPGLRAFGVLAAALAMAGVTVWLSETPRNRLGKTNPGTSALPAAVNSAPTRLPGSSVPYHERAAVIGKTVVPPVAPAHDELPVLVSPEERAGLEQYLASVSKRRSNGSPESAAVFNDTKGIEPLEITAIELKAMTTEPLDRGGSE